MKLGIVGLLNVGRNALFNSLTKAGAESADYSFRTINPNVDVVPVPDVRLGKPAAMYNSEETTLTVTELVDIAGLVRGASRGEDLGNQFLFNIREVDTIIRVVRCFDDPNVVHVDGCINPLHDTETINLELILSDIEILERCIAEQFKDAFNNRDLVKEVELLKAIRAHLEDGKLARSFEPNDDSARGFINTLSLLTWKLVIFAVNVAEDDSASDGADNQYIRSVRGFADENDCEVFVVCTEIKQEIAELDGDGKKMFLDDLGLTESDLEKLIAASYRILGLVSYLAVGPQESYAWIIKVGTKAPQAARKIYSDFECGSIHVEVVNYGDLMVCGSMNAAKEKGLVCSEDEGYVTRGSDVILSRFSVQATIASQLWAKSFMQVSVSLRPL